VTQYSPVATDELPLQKEFHEAVSSGAVECVQSILQAARSSQDSVSPPNSVAELVNSRDSNGCTALMRACSLREGPAATEMVKVLLNAGADVSALDEEGFTALHWAAASLAASDVIPLLVNRGAAVDARSDLGETPAHRRVAGCSRFAHQSMLVYVEFCWFSFSCRQGVATGSVPEFGSVVVLAGEPRPG
jgi:ankyrin repeat protein